MKRGTVVLMKKGRVDNRSSRVLSDAIKNNALLAASSRPREFVLPSRTWQVRTTKDASPKFVYLVLRNDQYWPTFCFLSWDRSKRAVASPDKIEWTGSREQFFRERELKNRSGPWAKWLQNA